MITKLQAIFKRTLGAVLFLTATMSLAWDNDPYTGAFSPVEVGFPTVIIKEVNGEYFGYTGIMTPISISPDHSFKSQDTLTDASGSFAQLSSSEFQTLTLTLDGQTSLYERTEVSKEQAYEFVFAADPIFTHIGQRDAERCQNRFDPYAKPSTEYEQLKKVDQKARQGDILYRHFNSFLVLKGDALVHEAYFNGWEQNDLHPLNSVTKSVVSLLIGSARQTGERFDTTTPLKVLLPEYESLFVGEKGDITVHDAASYTSGISWPEWDHSYQVSENIAHKFRDAPDTIQFVLERQMAHPPGEIFNYGEADIALVAEALINVADAESLASYGAAGLFKQLCFEDGYWASNADGRTMAAAGMFLRPRDMLKLGQLVLQEGKWQGDQLIDKSWLSEATTTQAESDSFSQTYGYYWWLTDYGFKGKSISTITALGYGGQIINVVPSLDIVIVMTAENFDMDWDLLHEIMRLHVFPEFLS